MHLFHAHALLKFRRWRKTLEANRWLWRNCIQLKGPARMKLLTQFLRSKQAARVPKRRRPHLQKYRSGSSRNGTSNDSAFSSSSLRRLTHSASCNFCVAGLDWRILLAVRRKPKKAKISNLPARTLLRHSESQMRPRKHSFKSVPKWSPRFSPRKILGFAFQRSRNLRQALARVLVFTQVLSMVQ